MEDPYLLEWWARDFGSWHSQYRAEALAPVQTRLSYYASSKRAQGHPGPEPLHHRPAGDRPGRGYPAGVHRPGCRGPGRGRPGGRVSAQPGGLSDKGAGERVPGATARRIGCSRRDAVPARRGLRKSMLSELGKFGASASSWRPRVWPSWTTSLPPCGTLSWPTWAAWRCSRWRAATPGNWCGSWARSGCQRRRHHLPGRAPLLRPRHRGRRADARLLHDGAGSRRTAILTWPTASAPPHPPTPCRTTTCPFVGVKDQRRR